MTLFEYADREEGERRKVDGMALANGAEPMAWRDAADAAIKSLASLGHPFSAEDVRRLAGDPEHANAMGARFSAAAKAGIIKYSHHAPSNRPQLHRCKVAVWVGR